MSHYRYSENTLYIYSNDDKRGVFLLSVKNQ